MPIPQGSDDVSHALDVYLFFPRAVGVTPQSYPREEFFRDTTAHLRLASVRLGLLELADLELEKNPGTLLRQALPRIVASDAPSVDSLVTLAQMYGAELADAVEHTAGTLQRLLAVRQRRKKGPKVKLGKRRKIEFTEGVHAMIRHADLAMASLRRVRAKATAYQAVAHPSLFAALAFAEEHATGAYEEALAKLATAIESHASLRDGTGLATRLRLELAKAAAAVSRRRVDQGFAEPWTSTPETYVYRSGVLKKELQRVLYIDTRRVARDPIFANTAAMVAAGLAATWATLAQVPLWQGNLSTRQGTILFVGAVAAYMVKDRIKEWTRQVLSRRLLVWDHDRKIASRTLRHVGLFDLEGRARERLTYHKADTIPADVRAARQSHRTVQGVTHELEEVIHYRRVVTISPTKEKVDHALGVRELIRYSLAEIIDRLDDATENVTYFNPARGTFVEDKLPKVYHLNMVTRVSSGVAGAPERITRHRVILDHDGIRRIEPVLLPRQATPGSSSLTNGHSTAAKSGAVRIPRRRTTDDAPVS